MKPDNDHVQLWRVLAVCIGIMTLGLTCFVTLYGRYGQSFLDSLEAVEPITVYRRGLQFENATKIDEAIAAYRQALALGISWTPSRHACQLRLSRLLVERGRIQGYRSDSYQNLLKAGSFEEDGAVQEAWFESTAPLTEAQCDSLEHVSGSASLRVRLGASSDQIVRQTVSLLPGVSYQLSFWTRMEEVSGEGISISVETVDEGNARVLARSEPISGTRDWKQSALSFEIYENMTRAAVVVERAGEDASSPGSGLVWLDGFVLERAERNLLRNGSFERGEDGCQAWGYRLFGEGTLATVDPDVRAEGHQSVRIEMKEGVPVEVFQGVDVISGHRYRLSGWIRTEGVDGRGVQLEVSGIVYGNAVSGTRDWTRLSEEFTVPRDSFRLAVVLCRAATRGAPSTEGTVWFDGYALERLQPKNQEEQAKFRGQL